METALHEDVQHRLFARSSVQECSQGDASWKRFIAVLCFIEFYVSFTYAGTELYRQTLGDLRLKAEPHIVWIAGLFIFRPFTFYLLGRALWLGKGRYTLWIALTGTTSLAVTIIMGCLGGYTARPSGWWVLTVNAKKLGVLRPSASLWFEAAYLTVPWLLLLLGGWIYWRWERRRTRRSLSLWVVLAALWAVGELIIHLKNPTEKGYLLFKLHLILSYLWDWTPICGIFLQVAYSGVFVLLIVGLLLGRRRIRIVPLIVGASIITLVLQDWYVVGRLNMDAIHALFYSTTMPLDEINATVSWWNFFILTRWSFQWLFVDLIAWAGPWILIAVFAWRVPMRSTSEDGSPGSPRFCTKYSYNLTGNLSGICPECGEPRQG